MSRHSLWIRRLFTALTIFTYFTMVLGGWVRNADAGLSCPDWPLCHGKFIPPFDYQIMLEYFHRLAVSLVSLSFIVVSALILANRTTRKIYAWNLVFAWLLLLAQIVLGGLTVLKLLRGEVVAMHLATAFAFFTVLLYSTLKSYRLPNSAKEPSKTNRSLLLLVRFSLVAIAGQAVLGGVVSSHYARWGCPDFPTCQGSWFPQMVGLAGIHYFHRLGAYVASLLTLLFLWRFFAAKLRLSPWPAILILSLLLCQWSLGLLLVFTAVKVYSVMHLATAILIFALLLIVHDQIQSRRLS